MPYYEQQHNDSWPLGQKPTIRTFDSGKKVAKFSVAVREYSNTKEEPQPLWFSVQAWNGLADKVVDLITKGREVGLRGRLAIEEYTNKEGYKVKNLVINMNEFHLCGKKPNSDITDESQLESEKPARKSKKAAA